MGFIIQIYSKNHGGFIWVKPVIFVPLNQFQDRNFQVTSTAAFWTLEIKGPLRWPGVCAQSQFPTATWIAGGQGHLGSKQKLPKNSIWLCLPMDLILIPYCLGKSLVCWGCFHPRLCLILSFSPHLEIPCTLVLWWVSGYLLHSPFTAKLWQMGVPLLQSTW